MMKKGDLTYIEILKAIGIHLITLLFKKTLLNIIKNTSSFFTISSSFDGELQAYLLSTIQIIEIIYYLLSQNFFFKLTAVINICLKYQ